MQQQSLQPRIQRSRVGQVIARQGGFAHGSRAPSPLANAGT
jgi:hypothetical protein